jgi:serine/threonine protein kinase HipA of HipAB toxin-antitoxin module
LDEGVPGSSAAGEQPKFAVQHAQHGHVIVKFSPAGDGPEARRWRDLLRAEALALQTLRHHGLATAQAQLYELDGRVFLESWRFDRNGTHGRLPAISLAAIDAEFVGSGHSWIRTAEQLATRSLLDPQSLQQLRWAELFGAWIGNTDMHLGNVSLAPTAKGFALLPLYDMLPMALAPQRGELPQPVLRAPIRQHGHEDVWHDTARAAEEFWSQLAEAPELDESMRRLAQQWRAF